ncbi:Uncharacterised protein [uncultured archaeon]|nr:Uncharacterised protein [uncultured archaeon]
MVEYKITELEKNILYLFSIKEFTYAELDDLFNIKNPEEQLKNLIQLRFVEIKKSMFSKSIFLTEQGKVYLGGNIASVFAAKDRVLLKIHDCVQVEIKLKNLGKTTFKGKLVITTDKYLKVFNPKIKVEKNSNNIPIDSMLPGESFSLRLFFSTNVPENLDRIKTIFTLAFIDDKNNKLATQEEFFYIEGRNI